MTITVLLRYNHTCPSLQERLRTLRASLGSSKAPLVEEAPGPHQRLPAPAPALPRGTRPKDPLKKRTTPHAPATPSHPTALMMVPHSRRTTNAPPEAADSSPEAEANGPEWVAVDSKLGDSHNAGRLLECQAVQGLCQLLEHHLAVLEQSQRPMGDLLQPGAMPDGMLSPFHLPHTNNASHPRVMPVMNGTLNQF